MDTQKAVELLRDHPFMEGMKQSHILKMAEMALEVNFARDQMIFKQGDESGLFYLILSGKVALEVSAPGRIMRIQTASTGESLGWSAVLAGGGKHFQARALEAVQTLTFDGTRLRQACEQDPAFGYQFLRKLLVAVAGRLQATRMQLLDMYAPVHGGSKLI
jgi:CRP/FNR family cyclic AMP-dependent transcriptional regulator